MIPLALDPTAVPLGLAGRGPLLLRRWRALVAAGARPALFADAPDEVLAREGGDALRARLPGPADLAGLRVLWVAGLADEVSATLAAAARAAGVLVNVEDRRSMCDFHSVAEVRRGELVLAVSTNGASPGLAARIRARLAAEFGPEWAGRVTELAGRRRAWRAEGRSLAELARLTDQAIDTAGWLA